MRIDELESIIRSFHQENQTLKRTLEKKEKEIRDINDNLLILFRKFGVLEKHLGIKITEKITIDGLTIVNTKDL